jgi:RibD C-terminal domain
VAAEAAAALDATDKDVSIGGAGLAAAAIELGLVDELRMFRNPVVVGGGTPFLPPVTEDVRLNLVETRTFGSRVVYERLGAPAMSRTDTAVRVIRASPHRVLAALTGSDSLAVAATARRMTERFPSGCTYVV